MRDARKLLTRVPLPHPSSPFGLRHRQERKLPTSHRHRCRGRQSGRASMPPKFKARRLDRAAVEGASGGFSARAPAAQHAAASSSTLRHPKQGQELGQQETGGWREANATVVPIQLVHEHGRPTWSLADDQSAPRLAHFPEAEFEDCSAYIDFARLLAQEEAQGGDADTATSAGKRKARDEDQEEDEEDELEEGLPLLSTACLFHVAPWDAAVERALKERVERSAGLSFDGGAACDRLYVAEVEGRDEASVMHEMLHLADGAGRLLLRVPLVDTDRIDASRLPHRFTNGSWLSACDNERWKGRRSLITTSIDVCFPRRPAVQPPATPAKLLTLQVNISVHLHEAALSPSSVLPSASEAELLQRLMRFASPSDVRDEALRRRPMQESLVYSGLRASTLTDDVAVLQPPGLEPSLIPFQRRSVHFLLGREGRYIAGADADADADGQAVLGSLDEQGQVMTHAGVQQVGLWWDKVDDGLYYNALLGTFRRHASETRADNVRGGILAEEMGLGKTVEVLALILLNPDAGRSQEPSYYDGEQDIEVAPTKTTLIVAPEVLRQQWLDETAVHAPELRIFSYLGYQEARRALHHNNGGTTWHDFARQLDVIVVSFDTLRKELNVAKRERPRSRRFERKYERPRSLLVQLAFHRVVMDEVQLVGHSMAAETVSLIARNHSLAVSGTPVKQLSDLQSLLRFLKAPGHFGTTNTYWNRLMTPAMAPQLRRMLEVLGTRHTKEQVRHEMSLPLQTRTLVPIDFTAIESTFYRDMYHRTLRSMGLDDSSSQSTATLRQIRQRFAAAAAAAVSDGGGGSGGSDDSFSLARLRSDLLHLRQACTHPQIAAGRGGGERNTLAVSNQIRSMDEVLTVMHEGAKADEASTRLSLHRRMIDRAVLTLQDKDNTGRHELARARLVEDVRPALERRVDEIKQDLVRARTIGPFYRFEPHEVDERGASEEADGGNGDGDGTIEDPGRLQLQQQQKQRHRLGQGLTQAEKDRENSLTERRAHRHRHVVIVQNRLRSVLEQLHRCNHFLGNICFQMGQLQKEKEQQQQKQQEHQEQEQQKEEEQSQLGQQEQGKEQGRAQKQEQEHEHKVKVEGDAAATAMAVDDEVKEGKGSDDAKNDEPVSAEVAELKRQEDYWYDRAEEVRLELLKESRHVVEASLRSFARGELDLAARHRPFVTQQFEAGGLTLEQSFSRLDELVDLLDRNAEVVLKWRQDIIERLRKPVSRDVSAENELDDQYQENLDAQAEAEALLEMYRVLLSERELIVTGVTTQGATSKPALMVQLEHSDRLARRRHLRLAQDPNNVEVLEELEQGLTEEQLDVQRTQLRHFEKLNEERKAVSLEAIGREEGHFETVLRQLRETSNRVERREEVKLARMAIDKIRELTAQQKSLGERLRREASLLSNVFNTRSSYFKQIQDLSDQVADLETRDLQRDTLAAAKEEQSLRAKADGISARLRYLAALEAETIGGAAKAAATSATSAAAAAAAATNEEAASATMKAGQGAEDSDEAGPGRTCVICTEPLVRAVLLGTCGHWTCEDCFRSWTLKRRACPICKRPVKANEAHRVTYGNASTATATAAATDATRSSAQIQDPVKARLQAQRERYNVMSDEAREDVARQRLQTSLGSKLDLLTRHLLQLQTDQPGAKSLIFTAFSRGVSLVSDALSLNGIKHVRLETGGKAGASAVDNFKNDSSVNVLILHSEAQSSGLNLVCATHVFLLEPLVNHAMELQAIGRVHRIGQTHETNVWGYAVNSTVEERITEMGRRKQQRSLFTHANCRSTHLRDSASLAAEAKAARNGERVSAPGSSTSTTTTTAAARQGEFVASLDDILESLFDEEADARPTSVNGNGSSSSIINGDRIGSAEDEREKMRRERLQAIERRQAMASIEQERAT